MAAVRFGALRAGGLLLAEQRVELRAVEASDHLAVDHGDGRGARAEGHQLVERFRVLADVLFDEVNALLNEILPLCMTGRSAGLQVQRHGLSHGSLLSCRTVHRHYRLPAGA